MRLRRRDFRALFAAVRQPAGGRAVARGLSRQMLRRSVLLCRRRRAHAEGDRRAGDGRHEPGRAARPHLHEPDDQGLSGVRRFLRDGRDDRADRRLLPPRRAGSRRAQADPLSAGPGRRRQILARRAAEAADGEGAGLCAEGRQGDQPGVRKPARAVRPGDPRRRTRKALRHSAAPADRHDLALGGQAARGVRRRHHQSSPWCGCSPRG